jgi:hypothetical protein
METISFCCVSCDTALKASADKAILVGIVWAGLMLFDACATIKKHVEARV